VLDLGDVKGPEEKRSGDRGMRRGGDFSIAECACLPAGRDCGMRSLRKMDREIA